jgi:hypothetical protein
VCRAAAPIHPMAMDEGHLPLRISRLALYPASPWRGPSSLAAWFHRSARRVGHPNHEFRMRPLEHPGLEVREPDPLRRQRTLRRLACPSARVRSLRSSASRRAPHARALAADRTDRVSAAKPAAPRGETRSPPVSAARSRRASVAPNLEPPLRATRALVFEPSAMPRRRCAWGSPTRTPGASVSLRAREAISNPFRASSRVRRGPWPSAAGRGRAHRAKP